MTLTSLSDVRAATRAGWRIAGVEYAVPSTVDGTAGAKKMPVRWRVERRAS
jgi:hypothetical protein